MFPPIPETTIEVELLGGITNGLTKFEGLVRVSDKYADVLFLKTQYAPVSVGVVGNPNPVIPELVIL